jgi:rod shape-determining protein MreC
MFDIRRISSTRWWHKKKSWTFFGIFLFLVFVRISKGSLYKDFFYFISKPFWPGQFQKEVILKSIDQESLIKLNLIKKDNIRLRKILSLQESSNNDNISAAVISRKTGGWWRQIILNKGSKDGVEIGNIVTGPGGLLGRVNNTSLFTSSVTLLTSPESKLGVWVDRSQTNGVLIGSGDDQPSLILYSKDADIKVGDFVSSSPASSLLPPNIPIGIVQSIDKTLQSKKKAKISLLAKPNVIDWVQILRENIE